jgi:hypothetical protein
MDDMIFDPSNAIEGHRVRVPDKTRATSVLVEIQDTRMAAFPVEIIIGEPPNERVAGS